jgi:hypothetical protein
MNRYPMKPYMDQMAQHGRYGDSMLVHMNPAEVQGIASLTPGGELTINPVTGQPEAFLPFLAPILGSALGWSTGATALASGALTAATTGDLKKGLLSGIMSFGLAEGIGAAADAFKGTETLKNIGDGVSGAEIVAEADKVSEVISATDQFGNVIDAGYVPETTNVSDVFGAKQDIVQMSPASNVSPMAGQYQDITSQFPDLKNMSAEDIQKLSPLTQGAKDLLLPCLKPETFFLLLLAEAC